MCVKITKVLEVPKNPHINCLAWNKKKGYLAYIECEKLKAMRVFPMWELKYPCPGTYCGGGDKDKDPRCAVPVAGFEHPHVVMVGQVNYELHINV